jgi:heme A synthase
MQSMKNILTQKLTVFFVLLVIMEAGAWMINSLVPEEPLRLDFVLGVGLSAALTVFICYLWLLKLSRNSKNTTLPITIAVIGTFLALPFTVMVGAYLGGIMGAGFVSLFLQAVLHVSSGPLLGIGTWLGEGLGGFLFAVVPTLLATALGYFVGRLLEKLFESTK